MGGRVKRQELSPVTEVWVELDHGEPQLCVHQAWGDTVRLDAREAEAMAYLLLPLTRRRDDAA